MVAARTTYRPKGTPEQRSSEADAPSTSSLLKRERNAFARLVDLAREHEVNDLDAELEVILKRYPNADTNQESEHHDLAYRVLRNVLVSAGLPEEKISSLEFAFRIDSSKPKLFTTESTVSPYSKAIQEAKEQIRYTDMIARLDAAIPRQRTPLDLAWEKLDNQWVSYVIKVDLVDDPKPQKGDEHPFLFQYTVSAKGASVVSDSLPYAMNEVIERIQQPAKIIDLQPKQLQSLKVELQTNRMDELALARWGDEGGFQCTA